MVRKLKTLLAVIFGIFISCQNNTPERFSTEEIQLRDSLNYDLSEKTIESSDTNIITTIPNVIDTLFQKWSSSPILYIGKRVFPSAISSRVDLIKSAELTGVVIAIEAKEDVCYLILRDGFLFTTHVYSLISKYLVDSNFLIQNGYVIKKWADVIDGLDVFKNKNRLLLIGQVDEMDIDDLAVFEGDTLFSIITGGNARIKDFLSAFNIQFEPTSHKVILLNVQEVKGSWFGDPLDKPFFPSDVDNNSQLIYRYELDVEDGMIKKIVISPV